MSAAPADPVHVRIVVVAFEACVRESARRKARGLAPRFPDPATVVDLLSAFALYLDERAPSEHAQHTWAREAQRLFAAGAGEGAFPLSADLAMRIRLHGAEREPVLTLVGGVPRPDVLTRWAEVHPPT